MARPLRLEYEGALHHITSRGNELQAIYADNSDFELFLSLLANVCAQYNWVVHAYCLMTNHYHLLVETPDANLSKGMRQLNGIYTQAFNRKHQRVGHVFQGRFKGILVQKDAYLLELARYIVLNPVRAQIVRHSKDWPWSSYRATAGYGAAAPCLTTDWLLAGFAKTKRTAQERYREFVQAGKGLPSPWSQLKNQIFLGDDLFVEDMQCKLDPEQSLKDIPKKQKQAPVKPLAWFASHYRSRDESMAQAYLSGHYTLEAVGEHFGVSYATVSRAVKWFEGR